MLIAKKWKDYECIDAGEGVKIERFGDYVFKRPEPSAYGELHSSKHKLDAIFDNKQWIQNNAPDEWVIEYKDMKFNLSTSDFKHLGIFPEQSVNWDFIIEAGKRTVEPMRILNLFGYTGAATIAAAQGNVEEIVHVDALRSSITRTQKNIELNELGDVKIRTIVDDVLKFIQREKRRGRTYHAIIMDPPSFGRGPKGEIWKIDDQIDELLEACLDILDKDAVYLILNTYSAHMSEQTILTILRKKFKMKHIRNGRFDTHEIAIEVNDSEDPLSMGKTTRWCIYEDMLVRD